MKAKDFRLQRRWPSLAVTALVMSGVVLGAFSGGILPVYGQSAAVRQGYSLLSAGQVDDAIATFQRQLQQNPNDLDALLGLGIAYRRAGRGEEALATYQRVLALDPNNQLALSTLGLLGEFRPEWQPIGIEALTRLLDQDPTLVEARAQRAKLFYYQGLYSQALADYAIVLPQTSDPEILGPAAEAHTFSGDYPTGLALFDRYRAAGGQIRGDRTIAYAQALRESGQIDQAIQWLNQELQRYPNFDTQQIRLRGALASTYATNRQFQAALDLIQPLRGRMDSRLTLARALHAIGDYSQQIGYRREAADLYLNVLNTTPNLTPGVLREASFVLGNLPQHQRVALQLVGQLQEILPDDVALSLQQQILQYELGALDRESFAQQVASMLPSLPGDAYQVRVMGQVLSRVDPPLPELLPLYQSLVAGGATEAFLHYRIAQIYVQQGRFREARTALNTYATTPAGSRDTETIELLLADIERREGNLAQSAQWYQTLLNRTQSPSIRRGALQGLAGVYAIQGNYPQALAIYDQLIAENPQELAYQLGRAALAYQAGLIIEAQATAVLNQGLQQYGAANAPPELITLATVLPPSSDRAAMYQTLLAANPGNAQLQLRSLQVLAQADPAQAQAQAAQLVASNPNNLDWYFVQGEIAQQVGDYDEARQVYTTLLQMQPNNQDALLALAGLEFQTGGYDRATELYQQALALDNQNSTARTSLASLNAAQGRPLEAIRQLQAWQQEQSSRGIADPQIARQIQQIQETLLLQRGIQPPWERF
jgi:tetratricopeptide (TPR) repeat protein